MQPVPFGKKLHDVCFQLFSFVVFMLYRYGNPSEGVDVFSWGIGGKTKKKLYVYKIISNNNKLINISEYIYLVFQ